jgi:hypothetical protein
VILMKRLMVFTALLILSFNSFAAEPNWSAYAEVLKSVSQGTKNNVKLSNYRIFPLQVSAIRKKNWPFTLMLTISWR